MVEIATLKKINLRDVWQDEGQFSDWLAENLSRLGDALGMELEQPERERRLGRSVQTSSVLTGFQNVTW